MVLLCFRQLCVTAVLCLAKETKGDSTDMADSNATMLEVFMLLLV